MKRGREDVCIPLRTAKQMNGKSFEFVPREVPHVKTEHRCICTPIPVPESKDVIEKSRRYEPVSMSGQPLVVWDHAEGYNVYDKYGNKWIDFSSGVMIANVGHGNPKVREAVRRVVEKPLLCTYLFPSEERADAAEAICSVSPIPNSKAFMLSAGTEAVETALKLARTYAHQKHGTEKNVVITFNGAFHGRTLGAQMLGGIPSLKTWIKNLDPDIILADFPNSYQHEWANPENPKFDEEEMFRKSILNCIEKAGVKPENIAGILTESYQGIFCCSLPVSYAKRLRAFCDQYDIVLFMDEIQTGFCRTGKMFAFEHYGIVPDLFTCAKGISGSLPMSAVVGRAEILDLYAANTMTSTHSGSPLAATATKASITYMLEHNLADAAAVKGEIMADFLKKLQKKYPNRIGYTGGMGMAQACTFVKNGSKEGDPDFAFAVTEKCIEKGLLFFAAVGAGITMKLVPPLIIPEAALLEGLAVYEEAIAEADAEME